MPLYEYKCERCGDIFEVIQKFSDAPVEVHEGCGGRVERLLSAPALQFKGTGWYITDYARKSGNGTSAGKSESTKAESKDTASSKETKKADTPKTSTTSSTTSDKK